MIARYEPSEFPNTPKPIYVFNNKHGWLMGRIVWWAPKKGYFFDPEPGCIFGAQIMVEIAAKINEMNESVNV